MDQTVYIGYASKDKPLADAVCTYLENCGIRCWISPRDILPGAHYQDSIVKAIKGSQIFILIFSSASNNSPHLIQELSNAVSESLIVIPFRVEDTPPSNEIQYLIGFPHWLDALTPPMEDSLQKLMVVVARLLENNLRNINVRAINSDICSYEGTVAVIRYNASIQGGIDKVVINRMMGGGIDLTTHLSASTEFLFIPTKRIIGSSFILLINGGEKRSCDLEDVKRFTQRACTILSEDVYPIRDIAITLQGLIQGLDEVEILKAELAGFLDAISEQKYPPHLETISIIEPDPERFERIRNSLNKCYPEGILGKVPVVKPQNSTQVPPNILGDDAQNPAIFLSFKNLDSSGKPTPDSTIAGLLYHFLEQKGLSVFNSNFSLEKLGASAYQKAIDTALDSAQILVAVGTSEENISSQ
jgi:hypothetical protein